jgi:pilus assembly protein Flp/PilA
MAGGVGASGTIRPIEKTGVKTMDLKTQWDVLATWIRAHVKDERGASLVEYALLVALIAVVCIAAVSLLGSSASTKFSRIGSAISGAGS